MIDEIKEIPAYVKNVSIVLVEPIRAGNVGSVARVMDNTGIKKLVLVNPVEYRNDEGFSMACNSGRILLDAKVFETVEDAVKDAQVVIGATRRAGKIRTPHYRLADITPRILDIARENSVSILFGREDHGLYNEEVELCDMVFEIPTHDNCPSLNLSQAVFAFAHSLYTGQLEPGDEPMVLAEKLEVERMYEHLTSALAKLGYMEEGSEHMVPTILRNFRRLFGRAGLMQKDVGMIRGLCGEIERLEKKVSKGN